MLKLYLDIQAEFASQGPETQKTVLLEMQKTLELTGYNDNNSVVSGKPWLNKVGQTNFQRTISINSG